MQMDRRDAKYVRYSSSGKDYGALVVDIGSELDQEIGSTGKRFSN